MVERWAGTNGVHEPSMPSTISRPHWSGKSTWQHHALHHVCSHELGLRLLLLIEMGLCSLQSMCCIKLELFNLYLMQDPCLSSSTCPAFLSRFYGIVLLVLLRVKGHEPFDRHVLIGICHVPLHECT